jgi:hypothetical protein
MYCSACGKKRFEDAVFCAYCGAKLPDPALLQPSGADAAGAGVAGAGTVGAGAVGAGAAGANAAGAGAAGANAAGAGAAGANAVGADAVGAGAAGAGAVGAGAAGAGAAGAGAVGAGAAGANAAGANAAGANAAGAGAAGAGAAGAGAAGAGAAGTDAAGAGAAGAGAVGANAADASAAGADVPGQASAAFAVSQADMPEGGEIGLEATPSGAARGGEAPEAAGYGANRREDEATEAAGYGANRRESEAPEAAGRRGALRAGEGFKASEADVPRRRREPPVGRGAREDENPVPAPAPNPAHRIFQRPPADDALTVRPLAANPAQPGRGVPEPIPELDLDFAQEGANEPQGGRARPALDPRPGGRDGARTDEPRSVGRDDARMDDPRPGGRDDAHVSKPRPGGWKSRLLGGRAPQPSHGQTRRGYSQKPLYEDEDGRERPARGESHAHARDSGNERVQRGYSQKPIYEDEDGRERPAKGESHARARDRDIEDERVQRGYSQKPIYEDEDGRERPARQMPHARARDIEDERTQRPAGRAGSAPADDDIWGDDEWVRPRKPRRDGADDRPTPRGRGYEEVSRGASRGTPRPRPARPAYGRVVADSGGMASLPRRRAPVAQAMGLRGKRPGKRDDLFFEDMKMPEENFYDEAAEENALSRKIKSIVAAAFLLSALIVAIWFYLMPGGQVFRASLGMGAPASAYKTLGDQLLRGNQPVRAAKAYHDALKLDPDNYQYALLAAKTLDAAGSREEAVKAYMYCVKLRPADPEPYLLLADLYRIMNDPQSAELWREEGYKQTGDESLAPA